jgi:hypothetical protein
MSNSTAGILSSPTIYGKVDYGPTFGNVWRPINPKRLITAAGDITVQDYDVYIIVKQTVPANFNLIMPDLTRWMKLPVGGFDLIVLNKNIGYHGTLVLPGGQKVDGLSAFEIGDTQGVGGVVFSPLNDMSGWVTL